MQQKIQQPIRMQESLSVFDDITPNFPIRRRAYVALILLVTVFNSMEWYKIFIVYSWYITQLKSKYMTMIKNGGRSRVLRTPGLTLGGRGFNSRSYTRQTVVQLLDHPSKYPTGLPSDQLGLLSLFCLVDIYIFFFFNLGGMRPSLLSTCINPLNTIQRGYYMATR